MTEQDADEPPPEAAAGAAARAAALRARSVAALAALDHRYGATRPVGIVRAAARLDRAIAGGELAGALAYRLFLWFLPFALVLVAGLGVYADASDDSPRSIADRFGLAGLVAESVARAARSDARWYALLIGVPVLLYVTRTLLRTVVAVHRLAWGLEPRRGHLRPANVLLFLGAVLALVLVAGVVAAGAERSTATWLVLAPAAVLARAAIWLFVSDRLPRPDVPRTALVPGALVVGVGFLAVNAFSMLVIGRIAESREDSYGALGAAAAVLFSFWLTSRVIVAAAVANATLAARRDAGGESGS